MTSSPHRPRLLPAFASAFGLAWAVPAAAEPPAAVLLHTSTCGPEQDAKLRRALEVELEALQVEPRWASTDAVGAPPPITLSAECDLGSGSVSLRVWASTPRLVLSRFVALRDVEEPARARTLALVISEALGPTLASSRDTGSSEPSAGAPAEAASEPADAPVLAPPAAPSQAAPSRARSRRRPALYRINPYGAGDSGELFTTTNPYGTGRTLRVGTAAQARLSLRDSSVLLGGEMGMSGPATDDLDATFELSFAGSTSALSARDATWLSTAFGIDFVRGDTIGFAIGPRLTLGYLGISDVVELEPTTERTLVTQLGLRSKFEVPIDGGLSALLTFGAHHTLGVYALTYYTGLDEGLNGWVISWSLGLGVEP